MADRDDVATAETDTLLADDGDVEEVRSSQTASIEQLQSVTDYEPNVRHVETSLYVSHLLSTWNSRLFEFGAFLFLANLFPSTLLPASIYALTRAAAAAIVSPWIGGYIDREDRLKVIRHSIAGQRLPVALSCANLVLLIRFPNFSSTTLGFVVGLVSLSALACVEKLAFIINTVSVERDWVIVIAGNNQTRLAGLNSRMRRIDLFCKLVAPLAIAFLDAISTEAAVIATAALSTASWALEYYAIARVYDALPELRVRSVNNATQGAESTSDRTCNPGFYARLHLYLTSSAMYPSLALSLLFLTSLSFAGQLITYLLAPPTSLSSTLLGALRGMAACAELSATVLAPRLIARIGPLRAGSWFLNGQLIFVAIAATALWLPSFVDQTTKTAVLISAVILSRIGLWGFDLSAQQQIQDKVPERTRGAFSAVEAALQNAFEMLSFAATIVWARPDEFRYSAALSVCAVAVAAGLYAAFVRHVRGHLLHLDQVCGNEYWKTHFGSKIRYRHELGGR